MKQQSNTSAHIEIHKHYGPALPAQNWVPAPRYLLRRDRVLRHIQKMQPCRVVDIGCGPATLLSEFAERGFDAVGVDRSADALKLAMLVQDASANMTVQAELDAAWKATFDLILSFEVIEHLKEDVAAMSDWAEYLKPGGRMILSTPAHPSRWNAADVWAGHVRRYTKENLINAITAAGFEVDVFECYGFPLANLMEVWRARAYAAVLEKSQKSEKSADDLTDESGSDRSVESRYWPLFASWPVVVAMKLACLIQRPFLNTQLGNGFLVIAKKI